MTDYVNLGDVCRGQLGMQCQYGSRYADPVWNSYGYRYCGTGLRILGSSKDYHQMQIHKDDVAEFVRRVNLERVR